MASQLKNILHFEVNGTPISLPHNLNWSGIKVVPDCIETTSVGFVIEADDTFLTVNGYGSVDVLVESWHTIEREFGDVAITKLSPQPFIVDPGEIPTPAFEVKTITIYARTTGNDNSGKGTLAKPYLTMQRAVRDVPLITPPGATFFVNCDDLGQETLPAGYTLPAWKSPSAITSLNSSGTFRVTMAVNIQAEPVNVPLAPASNAVVNAGDVLSTTFDPITGLTKITLTAPRASWGVDLLKGKQVIGATGGNSNCVVSSNTTTQLFLTTTAAPALPLRIVQPSFELLSEDASIGGVIQVHNCDSLSLGGIKITAGGGTFGLVTDGLGEFCNQMCELESPSIRSVNSEGTRNLRNWVYGSPIYRSPIQLLNQSLFDGCTGGTFNSTPCSVPTIQNCVFDGCDPIEPTLVFGNISGPTPMTLTISHSLITNGTGDGVIWHGGAGIVDSCDFAGNTGNGISGLQGGGGYMQVLNCGSSAPNGGAVGISVDTGLIVEVDAATSTTQEGAGRGLRGAAAGSNMLVGGQAVRSFPDFLAGVGGPVKNEYDITTVGATGATGTGSRLFQS